MRCLGMDGMGPKKSQPYMRSVFWEQLHESRDKCCLFSFLARLDFEPVFMIHERNEANGSPGDIKRLRSSHGPFLPFTVRTFCSYALCNPSSRLYTFIFVQKMSFRYLIVSLLEKICSGRPRNCPNPFSLAPEARSGRVALHPFFILQCHFNV